MTNLIKPKRDNFLNERQRRIRQMRQMR